MTNKESQNVEFKENWRDEYIKWICGFANANGGTLFIGKNSKGAVTGISNAHKLLENIPNKVRDILGIIVDVNLKTEKGKDYLGIIVEPYPYPVSYKGEYHYRSGSTKQELKGAALDKFLLQKQGRRWDGVPVPHVSVEDLHAQTLDNFREKAAKSKRLGINVLKEKNNILIEKLHLTDKQYLKRAAVLLFHSDPEKFVTGSYVKIGYFKTDDDLLFQDEIHGDLFMQVGKTMDLLLTKYLKALISYEGLQRIETYPVPEVALREILLNAVVHKDYASAIPVQISVYGDKIMIWNPGVLPENWTVETLTGKHASQPYNPDVANAFFRSGMIEAWGCGVERVITACKEAGISEPGFRSEKTGLWVDFMFPDLKSSSKTTVKTTAMIMKLLKKNPEITLADVAKTIGKSVRAVERACSKLTKEGKLRYVGPQKGGHWEVIKKE